MPRQVRAESGRFEATGNRCVTSAPTISESAFQTWIGSIAAIVAALDVEAPAHGRSIRTVHERLNRPMATLTFGGRFKAGKSTLLNAALRRPLLPTRDLPETGSNCHLSAGARDTAVI